MKTELHIMVRGTQKFARRIPGIVVPVWKEQGRVRVREKTARQDKALVAPAVYVGWQEGPSRHAGFPLYTLTQEIPGHSQWSTVSGKTLENAGFMLPARNAEREHARSRMNHSADTVVAGKTAA